MKEDVGEGDVLLRYISTEVRDTAVRDLLAQACELRAVVVLLDGLQDADDDRAALDDFIFKTLLPSGIPLIASATREGVDMAAYAERFAIFSLQPLGVGMQEWRREVRHAQ